MQVVNEVAPVVRHIPGCSISDLLIIQLQLIMSKEKIALGDENKIART